MVRGPRQRSAFCRRCRRNVSIAQGIARHEKQEHVSCKAPGCTWTGLTNERDDHRKMHSPAHLLSTLEEVLESVDLPFPTEWPKKLLDLRNLRAPKGKPSLADEGSLANRPHEVEQDLCSVCPPGIEVTWYLLHQSMNPMAPLEVRSSPSKPPFSFRPSHIRSSFRAQRANTIGLASSLVVKHIPMTCFTSAMATSTETVQCSFSTCQWMTCSVRATQPGTRLAARIISRRYMKTPARQGLSRSWQT